MSEQWKDIPNLNGWYQASTDGRIRSFRKANGISGKRKEPILMNGALDSYGYRVITITLNGSKTTMKFHRLVAETFIPNPEDKPQINHRNGIRDDNTVDNLEWVTNTENQRHSFRELGREPVIGHRKLQDEEVREIKSLLKDTDLTHSEIAGDYDVSEGTISAINVGKTWNHIKI